MTLTLADKQNPLLAKLVDGWRLELDVLRANNDGPLSHDETLTLRGRISCLKGCIRMADEDINIFSN